MLFGFFCCVVVVVVVAVVFVLFSVQCNISQMLEQHNVIVMSFFANFACVFTY